MEHIIELGSMIAELGFGMCYVVAPAFAGGLWDVTIQLQLSNHATVRYHLLYQVLSAAMVPASWKIMFTTCTDGGVGNNAVK